MLELALKSLIAYLCGALVGALIVGALRGVDIRELGSGNAGGTNALRTQGKLFAFAVVAIDVGKGWFASALLPGLALPGLAPDPGVERAWLAVACACAATVGHVYPIWFEFRGGKGAATLIGALLGLAPVLVPPVLLVWLLVVIATGFVSLGTMIAVAALPVLVAWRAPGQWSLLCFALGMVPFVAYTHRGNIARLRAGTEHRARQLWLLRGRGAARG